MILLDTHVLIWLASGSESLGTGARRLIDDAWSEESVAVSAISFWETAMLVEKGRIALHTPVDPWRRSLIDSGLTELPLDGQIALSAAALTELRDPADRFIVATAIQRDARLLTADRRILDFLGSAGAKDARS